MRVSLRWLTWLTILLPATVGAQATRVDLDHSGSGYPVYRIPALAVTNRGTLLASYDGRPSGNDLPSHIVVLLRRSTDGGKHWGPQQVVRSDSAPLGFGDPSFLVDRQTGRIYLFYDAAVTKGFFESAAGNRNDDPNITQADYSWSDDDGRSWQHRRITESIKNPAWTGFFAASGAGIQLEHGPHRGRLVQQYVIRMADGAHYGVSAFSDDHGATWRSGEPVGPNVDENKVVELSDGRLMLNARAKGHRRVAISDDGGTTWHDLRDEPALIDPANNAAIVRYDATAKSKDARSHWLLFSNTDHATKRMNLTLKLSCDDGATWPAAQVVEAGPSAYSTLAMLPTGKVGILYERGNYEWITFAVIDPKKMVRSCPGR